MKENESSHLFYSQSLMSGIVAIDSVCLTLIRLADSQKAGDRMALIGVLLLAHPELARLIGSLAFPVPTPFSVHIFPPAITASR